MFAGAIVSAILKSALVISRIFPCDLSKQFFQRALSIGSWDQGNIRPIFNSFSIDQARMSICTRSTDFY
jgi:hypothetical protein